MIGRENHESQQPADMAAMGAAFVGKQPILGQRLDCRDWLVPWALQRGDRTMIPFSRIVDSLYGVRRRVLLFVLSLNYRIVNLKKYLGLKSHQQSPIILLDSVGFLVLKSSGKRAHVEESPSMLGVFQGGAGGSDVRKGIASVRAAQRWAGSYGKSEPHP